MQPDEYQTGDAAAMDDCSCSAIASCPLSTETQICHAICDALQVIGRSPRLAWTENTISASPREARHGAWHVIQSPQQHLGNKLCTVVALR